MANMQHAQHSRPTLRMADGGMFGVVKNMFSPTPPETMTQKFARQDAERAAKAGVPSTAVAPTPTNGVIETGSLYNPGSMTAQRMKAAGLRDGGDLRTGTGGHVPGAGAGDKIPAKYEPGEFVVSNDMLDEAPQLREQLHSLRNNVLARKGMTPEQADAKALSGQGLRAAVGFDSEYKPNFTMPQNAPVFPDQPRIGVNPAGTALAVDTRPNFTMPRSPLPDGVVGEGPAPKGMNTAGAVDAAVKPPPGPSLRAGLGRVLNSGSAIFDAGKGAGNVVFDAGKSAASIGAKALKPALGFAGAAAGVLPHASAYGDDNISTGDKFKLAGSDALRTVATGVGGVFGAGVGSAVPVAGTIAGSIVGAGVGDHYGRKVGNFFTGSDDILRKSGRNPDRDIIDAAMNKDGQGFFGGGPGGNGPTPTAGGLPVQSTAGGLPVQSTAGQTDQMRNRSAIYPGQSITEQAVGMGADATQLVAAQPAVPTVTLRGQTGADMGNGISKFTQNGKTLFSNVQGGDNDRLMNRGPTSAQNQRAMDGIQARQDQGDAAYAAKQQYDSEVAAAQALRKGPTYISSAQLRLDRRGQDMTRDVALRGQDILREGNTLTRENNRAKLEYDMRKDQRDLAFNRSDYADGRGDKAKEYEFKNSEQRQAASKALHEEIGTFLPTGADGKPDLNRAAQYATSMNTMVGDRTRELEKAIADNPKHPQAQAWAANLALLREKGAGAIDSPTKQQFIAGMLARDTASANHGNFMPWSGSAPVTNAPVKSLKLKPGILFDDYEATYSDGKTGRIPKSAINGGMFSPRDDRYNSLK